MCEGDKKRNGILVEQVADARPGQHEPVWYMRNV